MQIQEPGQPQEFALFNLGFRPFFLFAGLAGALLMTHWLMLLGQHHATYNYYIASQYWHGHEMLFGYAIAVIAGFLLTAVRNWTQIQTPYGKSLAALFLIWLTARFLPVISEYYIAIPDVLIAGIDLLFLPAVALAIGIPIIRSGNYKNLIFTIILLLMTVSNLLIHLQLLNITTNTLANGMEMGLGLIVVVMVLMGGRVIPFFTERALAFEAKRYSMIEKIILPLAFGWLISNLLGFDKLSAILAGINGIIHLLRLAGWFRARMFRNHLIWILHSAYLFIPTGFLLQAISALTEISPFLSTHAFAAGAIGSMTLGMMARVSLGHTARPLQVARITVLAFILMTIAGITRIILPAFPELYNMGIHISGGLWVVAWILFLIPYTPILIRARLDGQFG